jgi:diacylglycerol kinase family enzyme
MKRIAILVNPHAGKGSALHAVQEARRVLWGWELDVIQPCSEEELQEVSAELNPEEYRAAIVIGGDGTVNQAIRGLVKSGVPLCPFPAGTANDLASELGITADWERIQILLDSRRTEEIDLVEANGVPFATVAGLGLGSTLTEEFNRLRKSSALARSISRVFDSQIYLALSAKTILLSARRSRQIHFRADSFDERLAASAVFVCNQGFLGKQFQVAPQTRNDDRKFNVLIITRSSRLSLIRGMMRLRSGDLPKDFIAFSTDFLRLRAVDHEPLKVFGDGEIFTEGVDLEFRIHSKKLRVLRPSASRLAARRTELTEESW